MSTIGSINASIVQDAFHYALAANGGSWRGLESAVSSTEHSRGEYMKRAYQKAREANVYDVDRPKRLADVEALLECLVGRCTHQGIDPFTGAPLCIGCSRVGAGDIVDGLCCGCRDVKRSAELAAIAIERARLDEALAALDDRVVAVSGASKHTGCCFAAGPYGSRGGASSPCWCGHGKRPAADAVHVAAPVRTFELGFAGEYKGRTGTRLTTVRAVSFEAAISQARAKVIALGYRNVSFLGEESFSSAPVAAQPKPVPTFTHRELMILADAVTQYIENEGPEEDGAAPADAHVAQEKLDGYVASLAG